MIRYSINFNDKNFVIDDYGDKGCYLYAYANNKCTHDYYLNTFQDAMAQEFEVFHVPIAIWANVKGADIANDS